MISFKHSAFTWHDTEAETITLFYRHFVISGFKALALVRNVSALVCLEINLFYGVYQSVGHMDVHQGRIRTRMGKLVLQLTILDADGLVGDVGIVYLQVEVDFVILVEVLVACIVLLLFGQWGQVVVTIDLGGLCKFVVPSPCCRRGSTNTIIDRLGWHDDIRSCQLQLHPKDVVAVGIGQGVVLVCNVVCDGQRVVHHMSVLPFRAAVVSV